MDPYKVDVHIRVSASCTGSGGAAWATTKSVDEQGRIESIECDRDRTGVKCRNQTFRLMLLNASRDRIVELRQELGPNTFKPFIGRGGVGHCP